MECARVQGDNIVQTISFSEIDNYSIVNRTDTYKRINHFREFLRQVQGKSRARIEDTVWKTLDAEMQKYVKHFTADEVTPKLVRYFLKKNKLSKYYEHVISITHHINPNYIPLVIEPEHEEAFCVYFKLTELPFVKMKKVVNRKRRNYMSYPFVGYKIAELFGWTKYMQSFELLKSVPLCAQLDRWWFCVCYQLKWPAIPTVGNTNKFSVMKNFIALQVDALRQSQSQSQSQSCSQALASEPDLSQGLSQGVGGVETEEKEDIE